MEELCTSDTEGCRQFLDKNLPEIRDLLLESLSTSAVNSKGPRLRCLLLLTEHARTATDELIAAIIPEAVLCCRDVNTRCRQTAYQLLTKMADQAVERGGLQGYMEAIMAGLAGSQHLASCSLLALATVMHHQRESMPQDLLRLILSNVCLLCCSASREIVGSALSFFKVYITSLDKDVVTTSVPSIVKAVVSMTEDCKRHFRTKTRDILARLVRWYSAESVMALVPESEKVMRTRLRNMRKLQDRKKRQRQEQRETGKSGSGGGEDQQFSVKNKPKSIDEILADLDESDMEVDEMVDDRPKAKGKKKNNNNVWIREEADDIVDFTDASTAKKISATKPDKNTNRVEVQKKKKESAFKKAPDGRMIIKDNSDSEDESRHRKISLVPGLSDSDNDDYEDLDEAKSTVSSVAVGRKRHMSTSTSVTSTTAGPRNKYQAGGVGIHRPIKKTKPGTKSTSASFGSEYVSKKSKGDVKRKGLPDPYAYLPLQRDTLNKRKRVKAIGQFKNILKGAKKGAVIGAKNKMKMKLKKKSR